MDNGSTESLNDSGESGFPPPTGRRDVLRLNKGHERHTAGVFYICIVGGQSHEETAFSFSFFSLLAVSKRQTWRVFAETFRLGSSRSFEVLRVICIFYRFFFNKRY